jgi:hypothetical protein
MLETPTLRSTIAFTLTFWLALFVCVGEGLAEITPQMHPWGRFQPGAWKLVRVITEAFGEGPAIASVTETKTTLSNINENDVTLLLEVSVDVAGKQFDAEPHEVRQGFNGEPAGEEVRTVVTELGDAELEIQGRKIPCKIEQVELEGATSKAVTQIYYSETVAPYILKRQSKTTDPDGKVLSDTTVDVIALDVPTNTRDGIRPAAHVKVVHKHAKGTTTTLAVTCMDVPGGIICHSLKELDESGRMVRRSWLELVDYGLTPDETDSGGFFHRRRARSTRKTYRYYVPR